MTDKDGTKIVRFQASNVLRLVCVNIEPNGNVITIGGQNGAGKTSVLDGIAMTIGGGKLVPKVPLRIGTKHGVLQVTLDNGLKITRTFDARGGSQLKVERDGGKVSKPQALLDELLGPLTIDPLALKRMAGKDRVDVLRKVVGLNFTKDDEKAKALYDDRAVVNREVDRLTKLVESLPEHPEINLADPEPTIAEAQEAVTKAQDLKAKRAEYGDAFAAYSQSVDAMTKRIVGLQQDIKETEADLENEICLLEEYQAKQESITVPDIQALEAAVSTVADLRMKRDGKQRRADAEGHLLIDAAKAEDLTASLDALKQAKLDKIASAKYPIKGLGIEDADVVFDNVPFDQLSGAKQIEVAMELTFATRKELKDTFVRDASLMDEESLRVVAEMTAKRDGVVWLERVGDSPGAIIMVDGSVKAEDVAAEAAQTDEE